MPAQQPHPWADDSPGPLDDAAVVRPGLSAAGRLVMTIDVVTPMVNDPELFGEIAAANALSDVYAMAGSPQVALSFVGFPTDKLPLEMLRAVFAGMQRKASEAGCLIVGGHTIIDPEPKAGLAVTGVLDADRVWSHKTARAGDVLVLSKAVGTGIIIGALKKDAAPESVVTGAVASMRLLNRAACRIGLAHDVSSATDVTGFGLLGHLSHLASASSLSAVLEAAAVPALDGAETLLAQGIVPGGTRKNLAYIEAVTSFSEQVSEARRLLLCDAQTSGGLLLAVSQRDAHALLGALIDEGHRAAIIGRLEASSGNGKSLVILP